MKILDPNESYSFSKIYELKAEIDELVAEFGYHFSRQLLNLPLYPDSLEGIETLTQRIMAILPYVSLSTEMARREILISPVVTQLVCYTQVQLRIEYSLKVSHQLQGSLDYFLQNHHHFIIIEAKKGDLDDGMTQLAVQLIALDQWSDSQEVSLLGAVTNGNLWQFMTLNRIEKQIKQGLENYRVPEDLDLLMKILVQALKP